MAITCATGSILPTRATNSTTAYVQLYSNSWTGNIGFAGLNLECQWGISVVTENSDTDGGSSSAFAGNWNQTVTCTADTTYKFRARVYATSYYNGSTKSKKSGAVLATASAPTVTVGPAATTATIAANYYPNVVESTCSAQLQYKKSSESTWTNAGTAGSETGYTQKTETEALTGLTPSTQYQMRLVLTRNTSVAADNTVTSDVSTFTTLANTPTVTTGAATGIAETVATLNATVSLGAYSGDCDVKWVYKTATPPEGGTTVSCAANPMTVTAATYNLSGLTASTTYYARATVYWPTGTTTNSSAGSIVSFATTASPAENPDEGFMLVFEYDRKYGVACDDSAQAKLVFSAPDVAADSHDRFINTAVPWVEGDVTVSVDSGSGPDSTPNNITALPTRLGTTHLYQCALTAAEMQGNDIYVSLVDANGPAWRDVLLHVRTHLTLGTVDIDAATGQKANTTAFKATGYGSGHGMSAVGGATGKDIDGYMSGPAGVLYWCDDATGDSSTQVTITTGTSAYNYIAQNDAYNGAILVVLSGTGAGQAREIKDYTSAGVVTLASAMNPAPSGTIEVAIIPAPLGLDATPGAELSALPTYASSYGALLQFLFQRFAYKRYQDSGQQILYKADSATAIATGTFEDNTTDQTLGKLA